MEISTPTLVSRHADLTQQLILDAAIDVLESMSIARLTVREVARHARISERTVFRYFASRDEFLDAVAAQAARCLAIPAPPRSLEELLAAPRALFGCFEARQALTRSLLHSDLFERMLGNLAKERWTAVRRILDAHARTRSAHERRMAAANIRYHLSATCWHYYRFYFGFSLDDTIGCAEMTIRQTLDGLQAN